MTYEERALAERPVPHDVTEVLEHDPADEADVQDGEQGEVCAAQVATGEEPEHEGQTHEERRQHEGSNDATTGDADRRQGVRRRRREPGDRHQQSKPSLGGGCRRRDEGGADGQHPHVPCAGGPGHERTPGVVREVQPVDLQVGEVVARDREDDEPATRTRSRPTARGSSASPASAGPINPRARAGAPPRAARPGSRAA
jgi:hypothetical protein